MASRVIAIVEHPAAERVGVESGHA
jgi:hypothetical protein